MMDKTDAEMTPCRCSHPRWLHGLKSRRFREGLCEMIGCHCRGFDPAPVEAPTSGTIAAATGYDNLPMRACGACGGKYQPVWGIGWVCAGCGKSAASP